MHKYGLDYIVGKVDGILLLMHFLISLYVLAWLKIHSRAQVAPVPNQLKVWTVVKTLSDCIVPKWTYCFFTQSHGVNNVIWKDLDMIIK